MAETLDVGDAIGVGEGTDVGLAKAPRPGARPHAASRPTAQRNQMQRRRFEPTHLIAWI